MNTTLQTLSRIITFNYVRLENCKLSRLDVYLNGTIVLSSYVPARLNKWDRQDEQHDILVRLKRKVAYFQKTHEVNLTEAEVMVAFENKKITQIEPATLVLVA